MSRRHRAYLLLGAFAALAPLSAFGQDEPRPDVRIASPLSTKPLMTGAARAVKQTKGLLVVVSENLTSQDALDALAQDKADIAILTRPLTLPDRSQYPGFDFVTIPIGMEVVALGVSNDIWDAGLHAISEKDMRAIYEQKITNWKDAGGPDEKVKLFSFAQGTGVWELLAAWLYGDNRKAPLPKVETVTTSQDARDSLEFTPGGIAPMGALFVDGSRCHALGIQFPDHIALPIPKDVAAGRYPIVRPIIAVSVGRPTLSIRAVTEFLTGPAGQALLKTTGALGLDAVPKPPDTEY